MSHPQTEPRAVALSRWRHRRGHPHARPAPTALSAYGLFATLLVFPSVLKIIKVVHVARERLDVLDLVRVLAADAALAFAALGISLLLARWLRGLRHGTWLYVAVLLVFVLPVLELTALEH
jgi:hypothetical protein